MIYTMIKRPLLPSLFALLMLCAPTALADSGPIIWQKGSAIQGGLMILKLAPQISARLDDKPLPQSPQNIISFGFHRDDEATVTLSLQQDNGSLTTHLYTPHMRSYQTQSISGLPGKYVSPPDEVLARIARDAEAVKRARALTSYQDAFAHEGFLWPANGTVTGVYGSQRILNGKPRAPHYGIDIAAPRGTPVIAPADGEITLADDLYYTGGTLIIDHGLGISSTMLHLDTLSVTVGDSVTAGERIGTVGSSGRSTGPHLDWRLNWYQKRLDPQYALDLLPANASPTK